MNSEIKALETLIDELLAGIQEVLQSGEVLSDEFQGMIADELSRTIEHIDRLREESNEPPTIGDIEEEEAIIADNISPKEPKGTPPIGGPIPPLDAAPHESSNINAFKYDPKTGKLFVKFQGKYPQQNGPVYSYEGVPPFIYEVFQRGAVAPKTSGKNAWHTWKEGVTPSHGASMYALIKNGGYAYRRLS